MQRQTLVSRQLRDLPDRGQGIDRAPAEIVRLFQAQQGRRRIMNILRPNGRQNTVRRQQPPVSFNAA